MYYLYLVGGKFLLATTGRILLASSSDIRRPLSFPTLWSNILILVGEDSNRGKLNKSAPKRSRALLLKAWSAVRLSMFNSEGWVGVAGKRRTP